MEMQIMVLDEDFNILGPIPTFRTLIWSRRYQEVGSFEIYVTPEYFTLLNDGYYLYRNDAEELGLIQEVYYSMSDDGKYEVYGKGYFAEALLQNRCIEKTIDLNGTVEDVERDLVNTYAINPKDSGRIVKHLALGDKCGASDIITSQVTGVELSEELYKLGLDLGLSHRIRYDYLTDDLKFEVWKGKDRTDSQTENSWAIFSDEFCNIVNMEYLRNIAEYKNYAYVAGEGEGNDRTVVEVDIRDDPNEERRELYVDARDLQSEDSDGNTYSASEYKEMLTQRGKEKLQDYVKAESAVGDIDKSANLEYKKDYDLGDFVVYMSSEIGVVTEQRILEAIETYEGSTQKLTLTFGSEGVITVRKLIKREV